MKCVKATRPARRALRRASNKRAPNMRLTASSLVIAGLAFAASPALAQDDGRRIVLRDMVRTFKPGAYQGRNNGPEQTDRFSRKVKIGRDAGFTLSNISGDDVVRAGSG